MKARYCVTPEVLAALADAELSPALLRALAALQDRGFEREEEFLAALYALEAPPATEREAAELLRRADRQYAEAIELLRAAYQQQMAGRLEQAERLYRTSIERFPTAEAHTFLGWTFSFTERYDEAIAQCRAAIAVDPDFGNPYNDIGAYLIAQGELREAIPWLERATVAPRYEPRHFPWANLGRVYEALAEPARALEHYVKALELEPTYRVALEALERLTGPRERLN
jgi:Tfp pilus assembly protein PilF